VCSSDLGADISPEQVLSCGLQDQPTYAAAFDGTNYVVAWTDKRAARSQIYASRVTRFGTLLDPTGVLVSASISDQKEPAIAWGGSSYLLAWTEGTSGDSDVKAIRLNPDLTTPDTTPFVMGGGDNAQYAPSVAWNGTDFMVVFLDTKQANQFNQTDVAGARLNPITGVITRAVTGTGSNAADICTNTAAQYSPSVASDGSNWLAVWQDTRDTSTSSPYTYSVPQTYYARLDPAGANLGTVGGTKLSTYLSAKASPKVAFDGTNYFIVWADSRPASLNLTSTYSYDIYGVRFSKAGARVDANDIPICVQTTTNQCNPSLVWAGNKYFVSWQDARSYTNGYGYDIYAARTGSDGVVNDPNGFFVSSGGYAETLPCLAAGGTNWTSLFYGKNVWPVHSLDMRTVGDITLSSIASAKAAPNGMKVTLAGQVVSAGSTQLTNCFYIEDSDRTAGIRIADATSVDLGKLVDVTGTLATVAGERQLINDTVTVYPSTGTVPGPVAMGLASLGGAAANSNVPGVLNGVGLNNIGLLVKVWGQVNSVGTNSFIVRDGTNQPGKTPLDVTIVCPAGVTLPTVGQYVGITGISSCNSSSVRQVLVRKQNDIVAY
jgi:hypothetical protein